MLQLISKIKGYKTEGRGFLALKVFLVVAALFLAQAFFSVIAEKKVYPAQLVSQHDMVKTTSLEVKNSLESLVLKEKFLFQEAATASGDSITPQEKDRLESKKFSLLLIKKLNESFIEDIDWLAIQQQELYGGSFSPEVINSSSQEKLVDFMDREISLMIVFNFIYLTNLETIKNLGDKENLNSFLNVEKISEGEYSFKEMQLYLQQAKGFLDENFFFSPLYDVAQGRTYEFGRIIRFYKKSGKWTSEDFFVDTVNYDLLHFEQQNEASSYIKFEKELSSFDYVYLVRERAEINRAIPEYLNRYKGFLEKKFFENLSSDDEFSKFVSTQKIIALRNIARRVYLIPESKNI